jgi:hypothetical protein
MSTQFDTVYHERFSYLSLGAVRVLFERAGLRVFDVEELPTHGRSVEVYDCHTADSRREHQHVRDVLRAERESGLPELDPHCRFQHRANRLNDDLAAFLIAEKRASRSVGF